MSPWKKKQKRKYLYRFMGTCGVTKTHRFMVQVQVKPAVGVGFMGTGVGWTTPTHTVPVYHPTHEPP